MKKITGLILIVVMLFSFSACGNLKFKDFIIFSSYKDAVSLQDGNNEQTPSFDNLDELSEYLNSKKDKNIFEISFYYDGEEPDPMALAQMVSCFYLNFSKDGGENGLYTVTIMEYPGDRMVDAYFSNDRSKLSADEEETLDRAIQMVSLLKSKAKSRWELELAIHDMLADHITYCDSEPLVEDPNSPPRFLTAVGAILDGEANCQGYADAFYVLASLADFTVGRMNVNAPDDLHLVNTILLDGNWFVVDVTFDDQGDEAPINYRLFNAGMDRINELSWESYKEIHKIAPHSGNEYYYIRNNTEFNNLSDFAENANERWLAGEKTIRGVIKNKSAEEVSFYVESKFGELLNKSERPYSYEFWHCSDGKDVFYTLIFE